MTVTCTPENGIPPFSQESSGTVLLQCTKSLTVVKHCARSTNETTLSGKRAGICLHLPLLLYARWSGWGRSPDLM